MKVATWCVDGVRGRLEVLCHWLKRRRPAVAALQKIRAPDAVFPADALARAGYHSDSLCRPSSYGVALLTRCDLPKPQILRGLPGGDGQDDGLLTARVGDLVVSSVYAPFGNPGVNGTAGALEIKLAWLDRLTKYLAERRIGSGRSVLCGDFNVLPDVPVKPGVLNRTPEEKRRLQAILKTGFVDLYRRFHASDPGDNYGFNPRVPPTTRLQLVLGSEEVAASVVCACVDLKYRAALEELPGRTWPSSAPVIVQLDDRA